MRIVGAKNSLAVVNNIVQFYVNVRTIVCIFPIAFQFRYKYNCTYTILFRCNGWLGDVHAQIIVFFALLYMLLLACISMPTLDTHI